MSAPRLDTAKPLVEPAANDTNEPLNDLEGAGALSSWTDLGQALAGKPSSTDGEWDGAEIGFAAAAAGLDTLGAAMNPLGALASAGVGWLIEHIEFLHEPLDWLAGDPAQITAQAHTWHNMSTELDRLAGAFQRDTDQLAGWDGAALDAYRESAGRYTAAVTEATAHAEHVSRALTSTGAVVGAVRATIRDIVADFIGELIGGALAALASAAVTAGGSIATFTAYAVSRAAQVAAELTQRVAKLLARLSAAADKLASLVRRFGAVAAGMSRGMRKVDSFPAHIDGRLLSDFGGRGTITRYLADLGQQPLPKHAPPAAQPLSPLDSTANEAAAEYGKQATEGDGQRRDWDRDSG